MAKRKHSLDTEEARERLFLDIIGHLLRYNDAEKRAIAENAEVHWTTIYNWTHGQTINPHIHTLARVARALGYDIVLKRISSKTPVLWRIK